MQRKRKSMPIEEPEMNLTPLIDVVFVILIIFIVIAPILELQKIQLAEAPTGDVANSLSVQEKGPISLHVTKDNHVRLNEQLIPINELTHRLRLEKRKYPIANPQLFCDKGACFGTYQTVKNAVEQAGFEHIEVVLQPN